MRNRVSLPTLLEHLNTRLISLLRCLPPSIRSKVIVLVDIAAFLLVVAIAIISCYYTVAIVTLSFYYIGRVSSGYIGVQPCSLAQSIENCQSVETLLGFLVSLVFGVVFMELALGICILWQCCLVLTRAANKIEEDIVKRQLDEITAVV